MPHADTQAGEWHTECGQSELDEISDFQKLIWNTDHVVSHQLTFPVSPQGNASVPSDEGTGAERASARHSAQPSTATLCTWSSKVIENVTHIRALYQKQPL